MPERSLDVAVHLTKQVNRQVARIADGLRKTADRLDNDPSFDATKRDPILVAENVDHELRWMYANLPVDTLIGMVRELVDYSNRSAELSDIIGTQDAAKILGVTRQRVLQMVDEHKLTALQVGDRTLVYSRSAVEKVRGDA